MVQLSYLMVLDECKFLIFLANEIQPCCLHIRLSNFNRVIYLSFYFVLKSKINLFRCSYLRNTFSFNLISTYNASLPVSEKKILKVFEKTLLSLNKIFIEHIHSLYQTQFFKILDVSLYLYLKTCESFYTCYLDT